ncbi:DMT family transporter [Flammeovirga kamogawensis]|uniref:DMT family transporter n=1 Tax=Flammeovirga kamogawensis TaxID=373891 RepID=A0ABX8H411_9BACT|nr:DMT family transporter [Flammeovirga kamogawensis]MBB6460261.1 drug/metabolite transporter (DMT)-like permease [Flammeovirga kamogawensis]QWG10072.1 DMT family transporter [Flammeovirga kamogawensis]TRX65579.1 DMT family transporter [Flammeovirga kamogawensis]
MKFLLLFLIAIIWGSQFILNDDALQVITPFELAFYRVLFGCITLTLLLKLPMVKEPKIKWTKKLIYLLIALTFCESVVPFILNGYGQQEVSSAVTSVLMASIPLMTILLERIINKRKIKAIELIGLFVGFVGLIVLVYQDLITTENVNVLSIVFILIGAFSFSLALLLMSRIPTDISSLRFTRAILLSSSIIILPLTVSDNHFSAIDSDLWLKLMLLGSFASGIVYYMYLSLVRSSGSTFTSLTNYLVPAIGITLGVIIQGDNFSTGHFVGFVIIIIGLILVNVPNLKKDSV